MTGDTNSEFDDVAPIDVGFISHGFGIVFPSDTGFNMQKQTGGIMCQQLQFSGVYYPLSRPTIRRGYPDWLPDTDGRIPKEQKHPITDVDLTTIPEEDYNSLPEWIQDRGHFYNWDEFSYWLNEHAWWYGHGDLIEELRRWNYCPDGSMSHARDMTRLWDGLEEIWSAIDQGLPFTYDHYDYYTEQMEARRNGEEFEPPHGDEYPKACEGIRWITLTGSKENSRGELRAPWAEEMKGETVILSYPNCD